MVSYKIDHAPKDKITLILQVIDFKLQDWVTRPTFMGE